jgi:hypothetical protein
MIAYCTHPSTSRTTDQRGLVDSAPRPRIQKSYRCRAEPSWRLSAIQVLTQSCNSSALLGVASAMGPVTTVGRGTATLNSG